LSTIDKEEERPIQVEHERRATHVLLASMASELEEEMKKEELNAIREEEEARERMVEAEEHHAKNLIEKEMKEKAEAEAARAKAHQESEAATAAAEAARKLVEDDERVRKAEEAKIKEEAEKMRQIHKQKLEAQEKDRQVLTSYLKENYPEKLGEVEELLAQFSGNLDVLFEELAKNQNFQESPESPEDSKHNRSALSEDDSETVHPFGDNETVAPSKRNEKDFLKPGIDLRQVVTGFYSIYAASKLSDIDDILRHFENRESDLFRTLEVKYDVTFATDGTCVPNNGDKGGDPFMEAAAPSASSSSKFAVDVQTRTLKDKLAKQGKGPETVNVVLSSGSAMM
jgi:hypothetical protein